MIKLPSVPGNKECQKIVATFMNDRLVDLMDKFLFSTILSDIHVFREKSALKVLEEDGLSLEDLKENTELAFSVKRFLFPKAFPEQYASKVFVELYEILKDPRPRVLEVTMEYLLYRLIRLELLDAEQGAGKQGTVRHIPEPERTKVLSSLAQYVDEGETAEERLLWYEDLRNYEVTYFWDTDFALMDYADEEMLTNLVLSEPEYSYEEEE